MIKSYDKPRQRIKKQRHTLPTKIHRVKAAVFPVVMYRCESWTTKKFECKRTDAFKLWCWRLLSLLDSQEIKPVDPKGSQPWIFVGRTDAEAEAPVLWPPNVKSQFNGKDPDSGKDWGQEEKGMTDKCSRVRLKDHMTLCIFWMEQYSCKFFTPVATSTFSAQRLVS